MIQIKRHTEPFFTKSSVYLCHCSVSVYLFKYPLLCVRWPRGAKLNISFVSNPSQRDDVGLMSTRARDNIEILFRQEQHENLVCLSNKNKYQIAERLWYYIYLLNNFFFFFFFVSFIAWFQGFRFNNLYSLECLHPQRSLPLWRHTLTTTQIPAISSVLFNSFLKKFICAFEEKLVRGSL